MKLEDLLTKFKDNTDIYIELWDVFVIICVAPIHSPVFIPYYNRKIAWIDGSKNKDNRLQVMLEIELDEEE